MINPGELTHRIVLQTKSITQDDELNVIEVWNDWRTVWCKPISKASREFFRLKTVNAEITEVFKIQYNPNVTAHQRIRFRGKYLEIIGDPINEGEKDNELLLTCKGVT